MYKRFIKRLLDITISLCFIIILLPLFIVLAVLIGVKLGRPVIFKQKRPGLNEKIFTLYKFRTMNNKTDEKGNLLPDSMRITKLGKIIRAMSLDELPELFNIIKGDMSIIGPRPLLIRYLPYYSDTEKLRHSVRPGLSGLAQINGRNNLDWDKRLELDVIYVNNISFLYDIKILFLTIIKVLKRDDITIVDQTLLKDLDIERGASIEYKNNEL